MANKKLHSFSVIVAAYNEEKYITDCILALKQQDYPGEFEIIVADNGSTDKTSEIARDLGARLVYAPERGVSHALIAGSLAGYGEIYAYTDADTRPPKTWLSQLNNAFNSHETVVGAGGAPYYYDGPKLADFIAHKILIKFYKRFLEKRHRGLPGFNMSIRKDIYFKAGGFEPGYNWGQDWHMAKRASQFGLIIFDPAIYVHTSFRRFHGNHKHPILILTRAIKEIVVALMRVVPMAYGKNLKMQKPIR